MNKTSIIFLAVGILILVVVGYLIFKPSSPAENMIQQLPNNEVKTSMASLLVEETIDYKTGQDKVEVITAKEGQKVVIKITSDVVDEAHLHGYDLSVEVRPGVEANLEFTANQTGRFNLELEKLGKEIGIIEIYPK